MDCGKSGLVVIDLDTDNGHDGIAAWEALAQTLQMNIHTRKARTGSGGLHLYFQAPKGVVIKNSTGKLAPGIDVRGEGGYVVLPPSIHPNGNRYAWE